MSMKKLIQNGWKILLIASLLLPLVGPVGSALAQNDGSVQAQTAYVEPSGVWTPDYSAEAPEMTAEQLENLMAGALASIALGIEPKAIQVSIENFAGLPHRIEFVDHIKGVD